MLHMSVRVCSTLSVIVTRIWTPISSYSPHIWSKITDGLSLTQLMLLIRVVK
jgi:hypothetical protein